MKAGRGRYTMRTGDSRGVPGRVVIVALVAALLAFPAMAAPQATGLRTARHPGYTRIVLDLTAEVSFRVFSLSGPDRVVVDLPPMDWRLPAAALAAAQGVVRAVRYSAFSANASRIVIDVAAPVVVKRSFLLPPRGGHGYRLVIDLAAATAVAKPSAPVPQSRPLKRNAPPTVVVDPGHGGADPGTISPAGTYEKWITLRFGRELADALIKSGRYRAVLTRNDDRFLKLRRRIEIAHAAAGDLFVSLHADTIANPRLRGASVYTLSETASDKEAAALAAKENKADILSGVDLSDKSPVVTSILIDLAQRETMNVSARFAQILVDEFARDGPVLRKTHRFAGFAVLKAPDIPSVLVELGYLSNREDQRRLKSRRGRRVMVEAILRAVDRHFAVLRDSR